MQQNIRKMEQSDREAVLQMMREFYASEAVSTSGSEEIFAADFAACVSESPYIEGYVLVWEGAVAGYAMLAKSFSTEFGKPCIWIEDLYLKKEYRGKGLGTVFLRFAEQKYRGHLFRLEVEQENEAAVRTYKKCGYDFLPYAEMKK